jgi:hypothetical protein
MTREELHAAFKTYFEEMESCVKGESYWALLHMSIVLPDICGALESDNGQGHPDKYKNWCKRYLADARMSASDWYALRCGLLHQGRTTSDAGRYRSYSLQRPRAEVARLHKVVIPGEQNITLDMGAVAEEIRESVRKWLNDLESPGQEMHLANLQKHLPSLARKKPKTIPESSGLVVSVVSST